MRKILLLALLSICFGAYAVAQDYPEGELSAGWNYLHFDSSGFGGHSESATDGFYIDGTFYPYHYFGLTARYEYNKKTFEPGTINPTRTADAGTHSLLFGPRFKLRQFGKVEPFGQGLFGFQRIGVTPRGLPEESDTAFAMKFGGGVDVNIAKHFGIRAGEFNYFMTRFNNAANSDIHLNGKGTQNNFTISAGIVLH
jgi:opacity protein-like surface antigen